MSATMAKQGGWVQLEESDMRVALHMAKMAKEGFLRATLEETKYLINTPRAKVREEKKRGVEFPRNKKVKAPIQEHPAMLHHNQTSGCFPCQNGTAKYPQTGWRCKGTAVPPLVRRRVRTPVLPPPPQGLPPGPTGNTSRTQPSEIVNLPAGYTYSHSALPSAEFFKDDQDTENDTDFDPDMLINDG
jgi:hypothetical protein